MIKYCRDGWPSKHKLNEVTLPYWEACSRPNLKGNLLLYGCRIVIPMAKQKEILGKLHQGHQGIQRCRLRAKSSVWWPGLSSKIEQYVQNCPNCVKERVPPKEPLMPTSLLAYPWQRIGTDLFQLNKTYLIAVDFFSRYPEVIILSISRSHHSLLNYLQKHHNGIENTICHT